MVNNIKVLVNKTRNVKTPSFGTSLSAGIDFYVPDDFPGKTTVKPGHSIVIPSGIIVRIVGESVVNNYALVGFNKSGVAIKKNLQIGAQVIDSDYSGEIFMHLYNYSNHMDVVIEPGEKIAQYIVLPVYTPEIVVSTDDVWKDIHTERADGHTGSTGTF